MAFTVYLADLMAVTYGRGYECSIGPSGSLSITGNNRSRIYAPGYWTQIEDHDDPEPGDRYDTDPLERPQPYYDTAGSAQGDSENAVPDIRAYPGGPNIS